MSCGMVACSPSRCSRIEAPAPSGCVPCETWASWSGSPSSTTLRAAVPIASASASDTCPASSITRVSIAGAAPPSRLSWAKSQAVPAKSIASEAEANAATSVALVIEGLS